MAKLTTFQAFVDSLPQELPAPEAAARAIAAGHKGATPARVHTARWVWRKRNQKPATGGKPKPSKSNGHAPPNAPKLTQLRRLILELGLDAARVVFAEYERVSDGLDYVGTRKP